MSDSKDWEKELERLHGLEEQLKTARRETVQPLRAKVVETCSDMLLNNPTFSSLNDILSRMWTNSIYKYISELRAHSSKSKKKGDSKSMREIEKHMKGFCSQTCGLYHELVKKYEELLSQATSCDDDNGESQESMVKWRACVMILFKMLIQLGDLYRYLKDFAKAENSYEKAAKLGPGIGNSYNQLAVAVQSKGGKIQMSSLALYYYVRSSCSVHASFPESNMDRLFKENRAWLEKYPEDNAGVPTKSAQQQRAKAQRNAASQRFLAKFVDLHCDLRSKDVIGFPKRCDLTLKSLSELMEIGAIGDQLLCKLVVINSFAASKDILGRVLCLKFGTVVADQVSTALAATKKSEQLSSVRGLLALLFVCEYEINLDEPSNRNKFFHDALSHFWRGVCTAVNHLIRNQDKFDELFDDDEIQMLTPKEYDEMKGFGPFLDFISLDAPFVTPEEAALIISESESNQSPSIFDARVKLARLLSLTKSVIGTKIKENSDGTYREFSDEEPAIIYEVDACSDDDSEEEVKDEVKDEPTFDKYSEKEEYTTAQPEDEGGDVIVYKQTGSGPALLVPGALLMNTGGSSTASHPPAISISVPPKVPQFAPPHISEQKMSQPIATHFMVAAPPATPIGMIPPSSFLPPQQQPMAIPVGIPIQTQSSIGLQPPLQMSPQRLAHMNPPPGLSPPPGFGSPPGFGFHQQQQHPAINAFLPTPPSRGPLYQSTNFSAQKPQEDPAAAYLDSSLLESLAWMDDQKKSVSSNPFLT